MPSPTILSYTLEDENGDTATSKLYVAYNAATQTVGALLGAAASFGGLIDAVTAARIKEFNIKIPALPDPAWKAAALADSDVQKTLLANFNVVDSIYPEEFIVPAVRGTVILPNGQPDLTPAGAIDALMDMIVAGTGNTFPNNRFLLDLISLRDAAVTFRKRKGSREKSKVKA